MNSLPVKVFHAFLSGAVLAILLSVLFFQLEQSARADAGGGSGNSGGSGGGSGGGSAPALHPTSADLDGDGIPNEWESQYHHNPEDAADAEADFDNDGLTSLQEYQLQQQTGGAAGNPLGKWTVQPIEVPAGLENALMVAVDINDRGDFLVVALSGSPWIFKRYLITHDAEEPVWTEVILPAGADESVYNGASLSENRHVIGGYFNGSGSHGFEWDPLNGASKCTYLGREAIKYKMNARGDWVGVIQNNSGTWEPAHVVNGVRLQLPNDWWDSQCFTDINEYGEALGTFFNPFDSSLHMFLSANGWQYDTGLPGRPPFFSEDSPYGIWGSAMNSYGEFAGYGEDWGEDWFQIPYVFDGRFTTINVEKEYASPEGINDSKTVVGYAFDFSGGFSDGTFVGRDGIGVMLDKLIPGIGHCDPGRINNRGQILTSTTLGKLLLLSPDQDQDGDGMSDDWEDYYGFNKSNPQDASQDADHDGTNNLGEYLLASNPNIAPAYDSNGNEIDLRPGIDTDGDHIPNIWEWQNGLDYLDDSDASIDFDRDGYSNLQEFHLNTDPRGAPVYQMREIGPTSGFGINPYALALGNGEAPLPLTGLAGSNITETILFSRVTPTGAVDGGLRPARWSIQRAGSEAGSSWYPPHGGGDLVTVAMAPNGAALAEEYGTPKYYYYWPSPHLPPISLAGAAEENNVSYLGDPKFSPSGKYLVARRNTASGFMSELVVWRMPQGGQTYAPVLLDSSSGYSINESTLVVNDNGLVVGEAMASGQVCGVFWQTAGATSQVMVSELPQGAGAIASHVVGISNEQPALIAGTTYGPNGEKRAIVWKEDGSELDIGIPPEYESELEVISPGGLVAGRRPVVVNGSLKSQPFIAQPGAGGSSAGIWRVQDQGEPGDYFSLTSLNDSGELLGGAAAYEPEFSLQPVLWAHGRRHPLEN